MKIKYQKSYWILYSLFLLVTIIRIYFRYDRALRTPIATIYAVSSYDLFVFVEVGVLEFILEVFKLSPAKIGPRIKNKYPNIDPAEIVYDDPKEGSIERMTPIRNAFFNIFIFVGFIFLWSRFTHQIDLEIYLGTLLNIYLLWLGPKILYANFKSKNMFYQKMDDLIEEQEYIDAFPDLINRSQ